MAASFAHACRASWADLMVGNNWEGSSESSGPSDRRSMAVCTVQGIMCKVINTRYGAFDRIIIGEI